jgi:hypothetical protein
VFKEVFTQRFTVGVHSYRLSSGLTLTTNNPLVVAGGYSTEQENTVSNGSVNLSVDPVQIAKQSFTLSLELFSMLKPCGLYYLPIKTSEIRNERWVGFSASVGGCFPGDPKERHIYVLAIVY